jgi:hypothetical protein
MDGFFERRRLLAREGVKFPERLSEKVPLIDVLDAAAAAWTAARIARNQHRTLPIDPRPRRTNDLLLTPAIPHTPEFCAGRVADTSAPDSLGATSREEIPLFQLVQGRRTTGLQESARVGGLRSMCISLARSAAL